MVELVHALGDAAVGFATHLDRLSRRLLVRVEGGALPAQTDEVPASLAAIARTSGLSRVELDALVLVAGAAVDVDVRRLLAAAGGARREVPTLAGLLTVLLDRPAARVLARRSLGPDGALVRHRLIRLRPIDDLDVEVLPTRRALAALFGHRLLAELPPWAQISSAAPAGASWSKIDPGTVAAALRLDGPPGALCLVRGPVGGGRTTWARQAVHAAAPRALRIDASLLTDIDELCELLEDAALVGWPVILDDGDRCLAPGAAMVPRLLDLIGAVPVALVAVTADDAEIDPRIITRAVFDVSLGPPPPAVRRNLWGDAAPLLGVLVDEIVLGPTDIAAARRAIAAGAEPHAAALARLRGPHLLQPREGLPRLGDIILTHDTRAELTELVDAIRVRRRVLDDWQLGNRSPRGQGISALFDGDSGTGKTMACDVVAAEVQMPIMGVNVASLVDKYIGETEKNLARVFAQARACGCILLFDEADALFGARVEVSRAQDRHINLETNLLLQLLEEHPGVVLLTTNLKHHIDRAFLRRITYKLFFDVPEEGQRELLWRCHLPVTHQVSDPDVVRLAHAFQLSGGGIKNAVVRACYRAAAASRLLCTDDLTDCAQLELAANGQVSTWS